MSGNKLRGKNKIYIKYIMELILALSLFLNLCYTIPELKKLYLEYKQKKNNSNNINNVKGN